MRRIGTAFVLALMAIPLAGTPFALAPATAQGLGGALASLPVVRGLRSEPPPAVLTQTVGLEEGWRPIGFSVGEEVSGLYLRVWGRVEFDRAEIVYADGELQPVDLRHCVRGGGLYVLTEFDDRREVLGVRMVVRARSDFAYVALKLGGDLAPEGRSPAAAAVR